MEVLKYVLESDQDGTWWNQDEYAEARRAASDAETKLICYEFEFSDSYVVEDFTPPVAWKVELAVYDSDELAIEGFELTIDGTAPYELGNIVDTLKKSALQMFPGAIDPDVGE